MGGLTFLQRLTGKISNDDLKKLAQKEHDEILKLKQKVADDEAQLKKLKEESAAAAKKANEERAMAALKKQIEDLNAKLAVASTKTCPPCAALDQDKIQLKDIPNVSEKFKTWIKSLPATTSDRIKIIEQVNTLPEPQRQAAMPSKQTQSAFLSSFEEPRSEPRASARRASAARYYPAPVATGPRSGVFVQDDEQFAGGRTSRKSRKHTLSRTHSRKHSRSKISRSRSARRKNVSRRR